MKWIESYNLISRRGRRHILRRDINKFFDELFSKLPDCWISMDIKVKYQVSSDKDD